MKFTHVQNCDYLASQSLTRRGFITNLALLGTAGFSGLRVAFFSSTSEKLYYSKQHMWLRRIRQTAVIGITNYFRQIFTELEEVDLPRAGGKLKTGDCFGFVTSHCEGDDLVHREFKLVSPASGTITRVNEELRSSPMLVNSDPQGKGWMIELKLATHEMILPKSFMNGSQYRIYTKPKPPLTFNGYVVTGLCVNCKYTDCAAICPSVKAFHELPDRVYIDPDCCINCDACVPECPVEAIFAPETLPLQHSKWRSLNWLAKNYPPISEKKPALRGPTCKGPEEDPRS